MRRKFIIPICVFSLIMTQGGITWYNSIHNKNGNQTQLQPQIKYIKFNEYLKIKVQELKTPTISQRPNYNINLETKYLNLIWQLCQKNHISYELVLVVFFQESKFNIDAVHKNNNGSRDLGLGQINNRHIEFYKQCAIDYGEFPKDKYFDIMSPDDNIRAVIGGLVYLRDHYKEKGISEDYLLDYITNSYHEGQTQYEKNIKRTGIASRSYSKSIHELKEKLETMNTLD